MLGVEGSGFGMRQTFLFAVFLAGAASFFPAFAEPALPAASFATSGAISSSADSSSELESCFAVCALSFAL